MEDDGLWTTEGWPQIERAVLKLGTVFRADVVRLPETGLYQATLNTHIDIGRHRTIPEAQARAEWEIWNRVRLMRPGYLKILERRESWETESKAVKKIVP